ncbi:MAG: DUF1273 family protein [Clostridia bacterium]|nr:DUF1273 family protein [Clostridia bacterium]
MKTLCVTGHRPEGLPWQKDKNHPERLYFLQLLKKHILYCISQGYSHFIAGGALGVDTDFALTVLDLKKSGYDITLEIAVPCADQNKGWKKDDSQIYNEILNKADIVTTLSPHYYPFCMQRRNEYMVNKSDGVLCCWNGIKKGGTYYTIRIAQKNNKQLLYIDLSKNADNGGNCMIFFKDKIT